MNRDHVLLASFFSSNQLDDTRESSIHICLLAHFRCNHLLRTQPIKALWWALRLSLAFEWNLEDSELLHEDVSCFTVWVIKL